MRQAGVHFLKFLQKISFRALYPLGDVFNAVRRVKFANYSSTELVIGFSGQKEIDASFYFFRVVFFESYGFSVVCLIVFNGCLIPTSLLTAQILTNIVSGLINLFKSSKSINPS